MREEKRMVEVTLSGSLIALAENEEQVNVEAKDIRELFPQSLPVNFFRIRFFFPQKQFIQFGRLDRQGQS